MRKKHQPGCPCCTTEEEEDGCYCSPVVQVDLFDIQDEIDYGYIEGIADIPPEQICCPITHSGLSAIEGTYIVDISGTPDFGGGRVDAWFLLNKTLSIESPKLVDNSLCPELFPLPRYQCVKIFAYLIVRESSRITEGQEPCVIDIRFYIDQEILHEFPPTPPSLCNEDFSYGLTHDLLESGIDRCEGIANRTEEIILYNGPPGLECPKANWYGSYSVTPI